MKQAVLTTRKAAAALQVAATLSLVLSAFTVAPACAEYDPILGEITTLRSPLIPDASWVPPFVAPDPGQPPPIGDGPAPAPVTPGMLGAPEQVPTDVYVPPVGALDKHIVNSYVAPYLTPPPSSPGNDPGLITRNPNNGFVPPASVVDINPSGGIFGQAPITRWNGQTTRDLGLARNYGAQTTDFGQKLETVVAGRVQLNQSEDGPRPAQFPGQVGSDSLRQANLPGAQTTEDLGFRMFFGKGPNNRSRMTIAPY